MGSAISSLIVAAERGDRPAAEALLTALYSELHRLAKRELAQRGFQVSLSATTLGESTHLSASENSHRSLALKSRCPRSAPISGRL